MQQCDSGALQDMPALVDRLHKIMNELVASNLAKLDAAYVALREAVCCDGHAKAASFLQDAHAESGALHQTVGKYFGAGVGAMPKLQEMEWVEQQQAQKIRLLQGDVQLIIKRQVPPQQPQRYSIFSSRVCMSGVYEWCV